MPNLMTFSFQDCPVRTITKAGEPWFVAADVCDVLGISNNRNATARLDDDEKDDVRLPDTMGRDQSRTIVNESGLYSLILRSDKPEARRFKKWVTSEVLPSIRKTGSYGDPYAALNDPAAMRGLLLSYSEKMIELQPKADAFDRISTADGSLCITNAAKDLQVRPKELFAWLSAHRWIYKRAGGAGWIAYQDKLQAGLLEHKVTTVSRSDGTEKIIEQVLITAKGMAKLSMLLAT